VTRPSGNENPSEKTGDREIDRPELPEGGISRENDAYTEIVSAQLKRGTSRHFEVFCDEPERIGGTDKYPSPMTYLAMAIGF
jgi:hypothetical protein